MKNEIHVTKLPNGNYRVKTPEGAFEYEQAFHVVTKVREGLNLLRLPSEEKP